MNIVKKLLEKLLQLDAETDVILEGLCPGCGAEMDDTDTYDGPDCYLCATCRAKGEE